MLYGYDPLDSAPALIALIVGFFVWSKHRADRRAQVFLALAASNFLFGLPLALAAALVPQTPRGAEAVQSASFAAGMISTVIFLHFGCSFPHARPAVRHGRARSWYWIALGVSLVYAILAIGLNAREPGSVMDYAMLPVGLTVFGASTAALVAIYRSYREMTADERARYRLPVIGVLIGLIASLLADVLVAALFTWAATVPFQERYYTFATNVLGTAAELIMPLFFFMAVSKYRLLDHHSQDYVAKL